MVFKGLGTTSAGNRCLETYDLGKQARRQYFAEHMREVEVLSSAQEGSRRSDGDGGAAGSAALPDPEANRLQTSRGAAGAPEAGSAPLSPSRRAGPSLLRNSSSWCFPRRVDTSARQAPLRPTPKSEVIPSRSVRTADACSQTEVSPEEPAEPRAGDSVVFRTGAAMRTTLEQRFRGAEGSIAGALYCVDDAELVRTLSLKARDGVQVRLVLDEGQVRRPSCSMQLQRMLELIEWGASVYRLRVGSGFAILHHKMWVVDGETLFSGSVNPTHHGLTCNEEHLLEIKHVEAVSDALAHIEGLVARATPVTTAYVSELIHTQRERRRSASASARRR